MPGGWNGAAGTRGAKKPATPNSIAIVAFVSLMASRVPWPGETSGGSSGANGNDETPSQNSRSRSTRSAGGLPAMSAALIAPIEMPATQSGVWCIAASDSNTPAWYAPSAPPPWRTRMHSSLGRRGRCGVRRAGMRRGGSRAA